MRFGVVGLRLCVRFGVMALCFDAGKGTGLGLWFDPKARGSPRGEQLTGQGSAFRICLPINEAE